jgi:hypothetical protein
VNFRELKNARHFPVPNYSKPIEGTPILLTPYPTPEEIERHRKIRADGYRSAMQEIQKTLLGENMPADREQARQIQRQLDWRSPEQCAASEVILVLLNMLKDLERENSELKARNQELKAENELFSRSVLSLQERVNAEKSAGKNPERS